MATADRKPGALDVVGQILVEMDGESASIEARGDRIVLGLNDFRAVSRLGRLGRGRSRRESIRRIHDALTASGLTLELVVGGSTVGLLGERARAGLASRILGLGPLEIRAGGVLGSWARRPGRAE